MSQRYIGLALSLCLLLPVMAAAQATTSGAAVKSAHVGQEFDVLIDDGTNTEKWFLYQLRAGRSYCVEGSSGRAQSQAAATDDDTIVTVFQSDGTTQIVASDQTSLEPDTVDGSRACFIMPGTPGSGPNAYVRFTDFNSGSYTYRMRLVETTLWASWFFIGGDYNAFTLLRNTTTATISYTMNWRNPAGTIVGTVIGAVPANGGIGINARTFITNPLVDFNGTVEVVHNASPEGLVGQVTSLSATTGLGFDSVLFQRKAW